MARGINPRLRQQPDLHPLATVDMHFRPLIYSAWFEQRKNSRSATSFGLPSRRMGISRCTISSVPGDRMAVSISPGETAFTRTP